LQAWLVVLCWRMQAAESSPKVPQSGPSMATVDWLVRHRFLVLACAFCLTVPAALRMAAMYGALRSDLEELLPPTSRGVKAVNVLRARIPSMQHLGIVIRGPTPGAPERFANQLGKRLATYPSTLVRLVRTDVDDERRFLRERWPMYLDLADLRSLGDQLREHVRSETMAHNPLFVNLDDDPDKSSSFAELDSRYRDADPFGGRFPDNRLVSTDRRTAVVLAFLAVTDTGSSQMGPLVDRVRGDIAALDPARENLEIGLAGDVAINVEELAALKSDLAVSGGLVLFAVLASIVFFYRWWRAIPALAIPLIAGTSWGFGLASIGIPYLNISTAFLGSIVIGNGINPGIVLLARFVEERRDGHPLRMALARALAGTWKGTLIATAAAASGYGTLIFPPLLSLLDEKALEQRRGPKGRSPGSMIAAIVGRCPRAIVISAVVLTATAAVVATRFDRSRIESDWSKLRSRDSAIRGEGYWNARLEEVLGRNFSSIVLLTENTAQASRLAAMVKAASHSEPLSRAVSRVVGPDELVPPEQDAKREELRTIARTLSRFPLDDLPPETRAHIDDLRSAANVPPIRAEDLPPLLAHGVREKDGRFGRTVLVLQGLGGSTWNGRLAVDATAKLHAIADTVSPPAYVAGGIVIAALVLETLEREAPRVTALAFLAVLLLVVVTFRRTRSSMPVLAALVCAVTWLAAAVVALDQHINFINFIAFPITFGIGAEYAINVLQRYEQAPGDIGIVVGNTGSAVVLCSLTTVFGYSSLLLAQNRALFSFGVLAVLGEGACIVMAVLVLPAGLLLVDQRRTRRTSTKPPGT
jgi:uncharacterized protein